MIKAARIAMSLGAVVGVGATFAACGGVPGNAVATVDGEAIEKEQFTHWMTVAAKSTGQANAAVPDPEADYKNCVAAKRKATPAPAKGQPKVTDTQLKTQCKTEYDQLRNQVLQLLISFQWIQGEASTMDVKVTDAEVKKPFDEQKKQSFPKAAGGKLPAQAKGTLDKELDDAVFSAKKNALEGPIKTQYGYYVFTVSAITEASQQTLAEAKETIKQTLASQGQQKALDTFVKDFTKRWKEKTECSDGYKTTDCKNGPKATPTPSAAGGEVPVAPEQGGGQPPAAPAPEEG